VTTLDAMQALGLTIVIANLALIAWLMWRLWWFRPVGWIGLAWMLHALIFYVAIMIGQTSNPSLNVWSSGLRLQAYLSVTAVLVVVAIEGRKGKRK
jgi:hypothetical protein